MDRRAYIHFSRRARERFGAHLSERVVLEIEDCIRADGFSRICDQGGGRFTLYRVPMGKVMSAVAYDNVNSTVITIMPVEWAGRACKIEREREMRDAQSSVDGTQGRGDP